MKLSARSLGLALLAAGGVALALTLPAMARRLRAYNESADFQRYAFQRIADNDFEYLGLPARVAIVTGDGAPVVRIAWRGETLDLPATGRTEPRLPGLLKVDDWLQVIQMRPLVESGDGMEPAERGGRVVVAARRLPPGSSEERYVNRKGWLYEIVELRRPEAPAPEALPAPVAGVSYGRPERAALVSDFATTDAFARWTVNFAALPNYERTWQYAAALSVTPRLSYPRNKFTDDGLGAMAWTWPAGGVGVLACVVGGVLLAASFVRGRAPRGGESGIGQKRPNPGAAGRR